MPIHLSISQLHVLDGVTGALECNPGSIVQKARLSNGVMGCQSIAEYPHASTNTQSYVMTLDYKM